MSEESKTLERLLFIIVFVMLAYFYNSGSSNQNARLDTIFSYVEPGPDRFSFRIDSFIADPEKGINTEDWSYYDGHYYANKAPGTAFLGILIYSALYSVESLLGLEPTQTMITIINGFIINLFVSVLCVALMVVFFFRSLTLLNVPGRRAATITLILASSTLIFPYSTQLWGHTTAAAFVAAAFYKVLRASSKDLIFAGALIGCAFLTDHLAVVPLFFLSAYVIITRPKQLAYFLAGGAPLLLLFCFYNWLCFGHPFSLATSHMHDDFKDTARFLGMFSLSSPANLYELTVGLKRGIFISMPILGLSLIGFLNWFRRAKGDVLLWITFGAVITQLLVNASFNGWHGGSSIGARYQIVALPFWILALKEISISRSWLVAMVVLGLASFSNMLVIAATSPIYHITESNPIFGWAYPTFLSGTVSFTHFPPRLELFNPDWVKFHSVASWNWGTLLGLEGLLSILPLLIFLGAAGYLLSVRQKC